MNDQLLTIAVALVTAAAIVFPLFKMRVGRTPRAKPRPDAKGQRRRAKLENERIKLLATFLNATGVAVLFATVILPIFKAFGTAPEKVAAAQVIAGFVTGFGFHLGGLWVLGLWRSEE